MRALSSDQYTLTWYETMLLQKHLDQFDTDGFVCIPDFLPAVLTEAARDRFEPLFSGEFATGIQPDEWNWRGDQDTVTRTRQICNAWKSDVAIAEVVLAEEVGQCCAQLMRWQGARINQDNVLWKPPGASAVGFHQDNAYQHWIVPSEMVTCWIALDDTRADGGTIAHARGSHRWPRTRNMGQFHDPDDYLASVTAAAEEVGETVDVMHLEVRAGTAVFHHGDLWHGSGPNLSEHSRRAVVSHCMRHDTRFHPKLNSHIYSRYRQFDTLNMSESFFPVLWTEDGQRTEVIRNLRSFCN